MDKTDRQARIAPVTATESFVDPEVRDGIGWTVVLGGVADWRTALGAVFLSGVVFFLLTLVRLRELAIRAVPLGLKLATGAGIGLFIAFIGLRNAGIVAASPATLVTLGPVTGTAPLLALGGVIVTAAPEIFYAADTDGDGQLDYLDFTNLQDPKTGKTRVRSVDVNTPSYRIAREYMIRLEKEDFRDDEKLRQLAQAASSPEHYCAPEQFRDRYQYLTTDLRGCN